MAALAMLAAASGLPRERRVTEPSLTSWREWNAGVHSALRCWAQ